MARDMADEVIKRPCDGIAGLAVMSETLRAAYAAGLERAAEIADTRAEAFANSRAISCEAKEIAAAIRTEKEKADD
jgi:hypothetical protein